MEQSRITRNAFEVSARAAGEGFDVANALTRCAGFAASYSAAFGKRVSRRSLSGARAQARELRTLLSVCGGTSSHAAARNVVEQVKRMERDAKKIWKLGGRNGR